MPANEQTWRDQKWMHVVFGISALIMLGATVWMLAKDHNREWRQWQLADRGKEKWALEARLAEQRAASEDDLARLQRSLSAAQSSSVDADLVEQFKQLVQDERARLEAQGELNKTGDLSDLDEALETLNQKAEEAEQARSQADLAEEAAHSALEARLQAQQQVEQADAESQALEQAEQAAEVKLDELAAAERQRDRAESDAGDARARLLDAMDVFISEAERRENALTVKQKFTTADRTAIVSEQGLAVTEGASQEKLDEIQEKIDSLAADLVELSSEVAAAKDYREALVAIRRETLEQQSEIEKELTAVRTDLARIAESRDKNTWNPVEWMIRQPILNALYDGNVRIDQIWLPEIEIDYNFSSVARYDRCTTCHRSIDQTAPGTADVPAYPTIPEDERRRTVSLGTPDSAPSPTVGADDQIVEPTLESVYGLVLASRGQVDPYAVTVQYVAPETLAAKAGLEMGDVVRQINGGRVYSPADVEQNLMTADWGEPIEVTIHRGLPHPFNSHPRLDLFIGSLSPHKKGEMGCTICHDGQGSATDFKWASHTPNDPDEALRWSREHGWFDNHHWIFPMTPERFIESNCLKCHHDVVDLEPSERFPEPPAPKLVEGYHLVREYGCYGCHEINGYDGPDTRVGPDMRLEPNYHEVAAAILNDPQLTDQQQQWAESLATRPESDEIRDRLYRAIQRDQEAAASEDAEQEPQLSEATHELSELLKDVETPGDLQKVGPSLRHIGSKVDFEWLYSWIRRPADFRPSTRMPQFFGLHEHLDDQRKEYPGPDGEPDQLTDREHTAQFEAIEIRALAEFLLAESSDFEYLDRPEGITAAPSPERGQWLFQSRGCLACHGHEEFPEIASTQGPDLSRVAAKFQSEKGQQWLYSWIKQPNRYHSRTVMPDLFLDPITETDPNGEPTGEVTDPAADILAFLVGVPTDWQPEDVPARELTTQEQQVLDALTAEWLSGTFPSRRAERYAAEGIPENQRGNVPGDEAVLVGMTAENRTEKQLEYVARRSISRYGCFGCHDIPGYESAKPIGTSLAEWGRKEPSKLAFENIGQFLATHGVGGEGDAHGKHGKHGEGHHGLNPLDYDDDTGYYLQSLNSHQRQGFIWQKLRMPRSYDYAKTTNKRYDERLRMPKFPFDKQQREAVITFVLGLVAEPAENLIYEPDPRTDALVQGRKVLNKYNCGGCHILDMERWDLAVDPDWFLEPPLQSDFPFIEPDVTAEQIAESLQTDRQGLIHASLRGMPVLSEETGEPNVVDIDGVPLGPEDDDLEPFYEFSLYHNAVVAGEPRLVGVQNLLIPAEHGKYGPANGQVYPGNGGDLAKYLYPHAIAKEHESNPAAKGSEAWGWLPPPLIGEGEKVQTEWLHDFLMDPYRIRPAAIMRMPNFRMSSDEASKLVNYFAAKDNADWPYEYNERRRDGYLAELEASHPERLDDAMNIVTDGNYCVKCHAVGDYTPVGAIKTQGPQLSEVYRRLRPSFVRDWLANPMRILPYTGMPMNIPYAANPPHYGGVSQELYPGTSIEQLNGVVDLLVNFDEYAKRQTTVKPLVDEVAPVDEAQAAESSEPRSDQSAAN